MEKTIKRSELGKALGTFIRVTTFAPNHIETHFENGIALFSYGTLVGVWMRGEGYYFTDAHDYSKTTSKYTTLWCGWKTAERRELLEGGRIGKIEG